MQTTVIVKLQGIRIIRTLIVLQALCVVLTAALCRRLQTYVVFQVALHLYVLVSRYGHIFIMLNVLLILQIPFFLKPIVHTTGNAINVLRQTAVWVRLVSGRENVPLMGVL